MRRRRTAIATRRGERPIQPVRLPCRNGRARPRPSGGAPGPRGRGLTLVTIAAGASETVALRMAPPRTIHGETLAWGVSPSVRLARCPALMGSRRSLLEEASQHPGRLLVHLQPLREHVARWLVIGLFPSLLAPRAVRATVSCPSTRRRSTSSALGSSSSSVIAVSAATAGRSLARGQALGTDALGAQVHRQLDEDGS